MGDGTDLAAERPERSRKPQMPQGGGETGKPSPWSLLEAIERFMQFANIIRVSTIHKTLWLF
uniref:Uncharacterized protein n=1 Tax=Helianthus annuus TaxID=4232 RepID=A0A251VT00_HELAN